jgi:tRNA threonylcarbamoyladenosine biosynthesis protein TsaE
LIKITIKNLSELPQAATQILEVAEGNRIFLFYANMGMGKTTLIKELCKQLGVNENVSSPTFSIVNEYEGGGKRIYHFDFYRLKDEHEAFDLGYEEYFYSGNYCFVEWPEKIENLLPESAVSVYITGNNKDERTISLHLPIEK